MFRVAICQDHGTEPSQIATDLKKLSEELPVEIGVDVFRNFRVLQKSLGEKNYHLLLLGTRVGGMDGLEFVRSLRESGCEMDTVFLAEDADLALEAYGVFPIGYLVEPITKMALKGPLRHAIRKCRMEPRLMFRGTDGARVAVEIGEIQYIEVFRTELDIHCRNTKHVCIGSLTDVCSKLPAGQFYRSHRSILVNLACVMRLERYQFIMKNGARATVAKNRYAEAKNALRRFIGAQPDGQFAGC